MARPVRNTNNECTVAENGVVAAGGNRDICNFVSTKIGRLGKAPEKTIAAEVPSEIHVVVDYFAGDSALSVAQINDDLIVAGVRGSIYSYRYVRAPIMIEIPCRNRRA